MQWIDVYNEVEGEESRFPSEYQTKVDEVFGFVKSKKKGRDR